MIMIIVALELLLLTLLLLPMMIVKLLLMMMMMRMRTMMVRKKRNTFFVRGIGLVGVRGWAHLYWNVMTSRDFWLGSNTADELSKMAIKIMRATTKKVPSVRAFVYCPRYCL
jgi:hypothetical protein